jgi:hypothetical protein
VTTDASPRQQHLPSGTFIDQLTHFPCVATDRFADQCDFIRKGDLHIR